MKIKSILIVIGILLILIISACSTKYVCSDGTTVSDNSLCPKNELNQLKQEVSEMKLREKAKDWEGKYSGISCRTSYECPNAGDSTRVEPYIECNSKCQNNKCVYNQCIITQLP